MEPVQTHPVKAFDLVLFKGGDAISNFIQSVERKEVVHRLSGPFDAVWTHAGIILDHNVLPLDCLEEGKLYVYESVMAGEIAGITYSAITPVDHEVPKGSFHLGPQLRLFSAVCAETQGDIAVIPLNDTHRKRIYAQGLDKVRASLLEIHRKYSTFGYPMNPLEVLASATPTLYSTLSTVKAYAEQYLPTSVAPTASKKQSVFCSELVATLLAELEVEGFVKAVEGASAVATSSSGSINSLNKLNSLDSNKRLPTPAEITPLELQATSAYKGSPALYARLGEKVYVVGQNGADIMDVPETVLHTIFPSLKLEEEHWVKVIRAVVPHGAKPAGRDINGSALYIGRVRMGRSIQIGGTCKDGILRIGWEGKEVRVDYEHHVLHQWPKLVWVSAGGGYVPRGAVQGGSEEDGKPLYIARAAVNDKGFLGFGGSGDSAICLGKVAPHLAGASFGFKGKEVIVKSNYEVLCAEGLVSWLLGWGKKD